MLYAPITGLDQPLPRMIFGSITITDAEPERSDALLDAALEHGINAFDTARVYGGGSSERGLGSWIARRGNRDQVIIVSKGCHPSKERQRVTPEDLLADIDASRGDLGVDHIDVWLLHRDNPAVPVGPIVEAASAAIEAGHIGCWGGSNWTHQRLRAAIDHAASHGLRPPCCSSPNYSLADQVDDPWGPGCVSLGGQAQAEARSWYRTSGMPVLAYSSLARGLFSGRVSRESLIANPDLVDQACRLGYCHEINYQRLDRLRTLAERTGHSIPQLAMAWVLNQPEQVHALFCGANREEIAATAAAAAIQLDEATCTWLLNGTGRAA